jgi:hypothetical protein
MNILVKVACVIVLSALLITGQKNVEVVHAKPKPLAVSKVSEKALIEPTAEVKPAVQPTQSPDPEQEAKAFIYFKESSNNPAAENSIGCYGLGQDCNGIVKTKCGASYECQDAFFSDYAIRRYGSFVKAKQFWLARVPINGVDRGNWW